MLYECFSPETLLSIFTKISRDFLSIQSFMIKDGIVTRDFFLVISPEGNVMKFFLAIQIPFILFMFILMCSNLSFIQQEV